MNLAVQLIFLNGILVALILYVIVRVRSARRVSQEPKERRFSSEQHTVVAAAVEVVKRLKYGLISTDEDTVQFRTGLSMKSWRGQAMKASITPISNGGTLVRMSGEANPSFQLYDWHETDFIAQRFLRELSSDLASSTPIVREQ
jgi:hypothetical protein